jgi:MFS transporter, DHA2 family, multidrug resistance protein
MGDKTDSHAAPLRGPALGLAAFAIALGNFLVVLDTTIVNVSVPTISGSLGVSTSQGTWAITAYAVAAAITVPLTGWLTRRFGAQRVFILCYVGFGALSLLCGISQSLGMLVICRVLLGLCGGPLMPLAQTLLLRIFSKERAATASVIWAMTTTSGPIVGPILGGTLCDGPGWQWIFFVVVPFALIGSAVVWWFMRGQRDPTEPATLDGVGLGLLIIWVGTLQILLDQGRDLDWFASAEIDILATISAIGFFAFLIWVLTDENPIVDLRIFRHFGFTALCINYSIAYGAFFASLVLLPLWLQENMDYTATWAGYATGIMGILAVLWAPVTGKLIKRFDPRLILFLGVGGFGLISLWRAFFTPEITFGQMAWPTFLSGMCMVMFLIPATGLILASVSNAETANAAGLSNFLRTLAGAFATSLVETSWSNAGRSNQTELAGAMTNGLDSLNGMIAAGMPHDAAVFRLAGLVQGQSVMLATTHLFAIIGAIFLVAAALVWVTPKPKGPIEATAAH